MYPSYFISTSTVALTALNGTMEKTFAVEGLPSDLCHVTIKNVASAAFCSNVRLLNQGEIKLHDILVDGVHDLGRESPHMDHGIYAVRIGDTRLYGLRHATADETYHITVRNVRAAGDYAVGLAGAIRDLVLYGIECAEGTKMLRDDRNCN